MSFRIVCPYCFHEMEDHQVCFRSERVLSPMDAPIPDEYDDTDDFIARYRGADKEAILKKIREWEFFQEGDDPVYHNWWEKYDGTTENNPADDLLGVKAYRRPVLDPSKTYHTNYLKQQADGTWFIHDADGMVTQIELKTGERCGRRVCRHCHNPLPDNYGKSPVKFASIIGITGAGKTVYLSQLLRNMKSYTAKVGLSSIVKNSSTVTFLENNRIAAKQPLPGSTPAKRLQQPLFYELDRRTADGGKTTDTFVLYDVAGEVFKDPQMVKGFAPFIEHSDGLILLIDPMQFDAVSMGVEGGKTLDDATKALDSIHDIVAGSRNKLCDVPCAVCISKVDTEAVQNVLPPALAPRLLEEVAGVRAPNRLYRTIFNAKQYNPIVRELEEWINASGEDALAQHLFDDYSTYSYFAFTALGCDVVTGIVDGIETQYPEGPIVPRRVEEPLLWLFYKLGYIEANERLYEPGKEIVYCPNPECGSEDTDPLPDGSYITTGSFIFKKQIPVNYECHVCGYKWLRDSDDSTN